MANNLRYLLEHFCLDGQKIDISSQLDEENANNIEKINTQTIPSINARIDDIKNTDIPNINRRIDNIKNTDIPSINQKINTINNTTIPSVQASVTAVDEKADSINESVTKNTKDIGTLSDNVTMQGNAINSIETEKIPSVEHKVEIVAHETQRISGVHEHDMNGINESLSALHGETSSNTTNIGNLTTSVNELTTKVGANTDSINGLTTKVNANTDSINTINNTSIPHLQNQIDRLSSGGSGSIGELREKVEKNTSDISELNGKVDTNTSNISELSGKVDTNTVNITTLSGKVDTNTSAISTINNTSIPHLQNEIDNIPSLKSWELIKEISTTDNAGVIYNIKLYSNSNINYLYIDCDFKNVTEIKTGFLYGAGVDLSELPLPLTKNIQFTCPVTYFYDTIGTVTIARAYNDTFLLALMLKNKPTSTTFVTVGGLYYF